MERARICTIKALDDLHSAAAARAGGPLENWRGLSLIPIGGTGFSGGNMEERSTQHELVGAMSVSKQAVVANAVEPVRQDVEQKAAHELASGELHDLVLVVAILTVVFPAKTDVVIVEIEQPAIGDGDTVGVTGQIGENLLRACEWTLGVHDPFLRAQGSEVGLECVRLVEAGQVCEELKFSRIVQCLEAFEEQPPKQPREHAHRQEEAGPARSPTLAVWRHTTARHDAVHVGMVIEVLSPGVQDSGEVDVGT